MKTNLRTVKPNGKHGMKLSLADELKAIGVSVNQDVKVEVDGDVIKITKWQKRY
jgi:hypothetical protein